MEVVKMTFQNYLPIQQAPFSSSANAVFQPGFAGTNAQEVRYLNNGGQIPAASTYGAPVQGGFGGVQAVFQPGFAGTNAQEVRQQNQVGFASFGPGAGYPQAAFGYPQAQAGYQQQFAGSAQSIFSPGFAGTNVQEVQARNNTSFGGGFNNAYTGFAGPAAGNVGSIFSPGFAGTNVQEVRQLNQPGYSSFGAGFGFQAQPQQSFAAPFGGSVQAVFQPGFAGTNVQEVRALNAGQQAPYAGYNFAGF